MSRLLRNRRASEESGPEQHRSLNLIRHHERQKKRSSARQPASGRTVAQGCGPAGATARTAQGRRGRISERGTDGASARMRVWRRVGLGSPARRRGRALARALRGVRLDDDLLATKALHKKRPALPILDNQAVLGAYMNPHWPERRSMGDTIKAVPRIRDALNWIPANRASARSTLFTSTGCQAATGCSPHRSGWLTSLPSNRRRVRPSAGVRRPRVALLTAIAFGMSSSRSDRPRSVR
jgi:hypothetical protein